jgi:hypothetical protein
MQEKYKVVCGDLHSVCIARSHLEAAVASLQFANGEHKLDHEFHVSPVDGGDTEVIPFGLVLREAEWEEDKMGL